jgi:serralysin
MIGGSGDDTYVVDVPGDIITELPSGGTDKVLSFISYTLSENIENLELLGITDIDGTGNDFVNNIIGNFGDNIIESGAGNDTIDGFGGVDQIFAGDGFCTGRQWERYIFN